ncbi:MAG: CHAT domain-containing protein [Symploca sp. SIO2B6]|nr:CHAT domain-containing protein [Symploca sp. SIO2B6]
MPRASFLRLRYQSICVGIALLTCLLVISISPGLAQKSHFQEVGDSKPTDCLPPGNSWQLGRKKPSALGLLPPAFAFELPQPEKLLASAKVETKLSSTPRLLSKQEVINSKNSADVYSLLERGKKLFAEGDFTEAHRVWQQAAQSYQQQLDWLGQARALNYVSLAQLNLGAWETAQSTINQSLNLLKSSESLNLEGKKILAHTLNTQGNIQLVLGQAEEALFTWQQAAIIYQSVGDVSGFLGSQINQAKAWQSLGNYQRSQQLLDASLTQLQSQPDAAIKATGLRSLGVALQAVGDLSQSQISLEQSLTIVEGLEVTNPVFAREKTAILMALGKTLAALQKTEEALERYQQAAATTDTLTSTKAQLLQLSLLLEIINKSCSSTITPDGEELGNWTQVLALLPQIQSNLVKLSPSREAVYARVNFVASLMKIRRGGDGERGEWGEQVGINYQELAQILAQAVAQARRLQDLRAQTYALGQLGHLYESSRQWQEAKELTQQALLIAVENNAPDIAYQWQWQLGRILQQQGKTSKAITAYSNAITNLQSLRQELVILNSDVQFAFTETVEPVYRELVALLLQSAPNQNNLQRVRELIEALQVAELENFFRQACLQPLAKQIDEVDLKAAVIYPIMLPDSLVVIVSTPGQPLFHYQTKLTQAEVETAIAQLRLYLNPHFFDEDRLQRSQQIYDWLIRPAEAKFMKNGVETLVFVLDGLLRSLPMAALHDGQNYLIEKYSIALTPGLQLLEPQTLANKPLKALTAGLSESRQGFAALPAVENEVNQIASNFNSSILLNQNFTSEQLKKQINKLPFPIIHLATHGQFSSNSQETFLVTWDGRLNVDDLNELLRAKQQDLNNPIELLVLSACQTATGDKKAALGLAGLAVRSGARSTLATLWQVKDESTASLMVKFYQQLAQEQSMTKAQALRKAQLELLKQPQYQHPFYWAPFVLVGNWL